MAILFLPQWVQATPTLSTAEKSAANCRLLHSPSIWTVSRAKDMARNGTGWHCPTVIGWSQHRLENALVALKSGMWLLGISIFQGPLTVPLCTQNSRYMPAIIRWCPAKRALCLRTADRALLAGYPRYGLSKETVKESIVIRMLRVFPQHVPWYVAPQVILAQLQTRKKTCENGTSKTLLQCMLNTNRLGKNLISFAKSFISIPP